MTQYEKKNLMCAENWSIKLSLSHRIKLAKERTETKMSKKSEKHYRKSTKAVTMGSICHCSVISQQKLLLPPPTPLILL